MVVAENPGADACSVPLAAKLLRDFPHTRTERSAERPGFAERPDSAATFDIVPPHLLIPPDVPITGGSRTDAAVVLDRHLVALAGMDGHCRLIVARIVRRLMDTRSWRRLGFVRLSDYSRERLGVSSRCLEEDARVVRALDALPQLSAALASGLIGWTKVRMLVGRATTENEGELLQRALELPTRELETLLQKREGANANADAGCDAGAVRDASATAESSAAEVAGDGTNDSAGAQPASGTVSYESADPDVRWSITVSRTGRRLWRAACEYASRTAGCPLSPAQVLELVVAEAASGTPLRSMGPQAAWSPDLETLRQRLIHLQRRNDDRGTRALLSYLAEIGVVEGFSWLEPASYSAGPASSLEKLASNLEHTDAFELDRRLRELRLAMQRIDSQLGALLCIGVDRRLFREIGFATVKLYVESRLGCSSRKVWSLIAIERETWRVCPELRSAWREGRVSHLAACALLPVMGPHFGERWIRRAGEVTLRRLIDEVAWALDYGERDGAWSRPAPPPPGADIRMDGVGDVADDEVQMRAHAKDAEDRLVPAGGVRLAFHLPVSVAALTELVLYQWSDGIERPWRAFERMIAAALLEWTSAPRHRDPVFERDGWRCTVPGCSSRRNLHDHHVLFRSHGGGNSRDNRTTVCVQHHLHGIHEGIVRATGRAPDGLLWEIGCRSAAQPLMRLRGDRYLWIEEAA
jgi:hypothetical protein